MISIALNRLISSDSFVSRLRKTQTKKDVPFDPDEAKRRQEEAVCQHEGEDEDDDDDGFQEKEEIEDNDKDVDDVFGD